MERLATLIGIVLAGAAAGAVAKAADESTVTWASDLGTHPAIWVLAIAIIARLAPSGSWAAGRAGAFFVAMTCAYYAWSSLILGFPLDRWIAVWNALAVTAVPMLAFAAWWATHRRGLVPAAVLAGMAGTAMAGGAMHQWLLWVRGELPSEFPVRPVQAIAEGLVVVVIVGLLPVYGRTRVWAVPLALVLAPVVTILIDQVVGRLLR